METPKLTPTSLAWPNPESTQPRPGSIRSKPRILVRPLCHNCSFLFPKAGNRKGLPAATLRSRRRANFRAGTVHAARLGGNLFWIPKDMGVGPRALFNCIYGLRGSSTIANGPRHRHLLIVLIAAQDVKVIISEARPRAVSLIAMSLWRPAGPGVAGRRREGHHSGAARGQKAEAAGDR